MTITNTFKIKLHKWLILTVSWMVIGALISLYTFLATRTEMIAARENYRFMASLLSGVGGGFFGGLIGGSIMIFVLQDRFKKKSFITKVLINMGFVMVVILMVNVILSFFFIMYSDDPELVRINSFERFWERLFSYGHLLSQITWLTIVSVTTFVFSVADNYGPHVFLDMILGRFHRPHEEQRIFMFVDIRSSTAIAEDLGHQRYFEFLQDFYADITDPVVNARGRIYQYVGDEVVITWDMAGGLRDNNCLRCFFDMQDVFRKLSDKYLHKFGLVPTFKAGLHYGKVTVGEVGVLKKDIIYTGDVLNTTSRIQNKCNWLDVDLLISQDLVSLIPVKALYHFESLGKIDLRGKSSMVELMAIMPRLKVQRQLDAFPAGAVQVGNPQAKQADGAPF